MARELNVRLEYAADKDVLFIVVLPEREIETRTMGYDHGFLVFHDVQDRRVITGIEAHDFTETVCGLDCNSVTSPKFDFTFNVIRSSLRGIHFEDLLKWAYGQFVAKAELAEAA